jgi:hypothetical protein
LRARCGTQAGVALEAIRKTMTMIQAFLQHAIEWGRVPTNDLRHAFASLLIHEGRLSVLEIAAQLGHNATVCLDTDAHVMAEREVASESGPRNRSSRLDGRWNVGEASRARSNWTSSRRSRAFGYAGDARRAACYQVPVASGVAGRGSSRTTGMEYA